VSDDAIESAEQIVADVEAVQDLGILPVSGPYAAVGSVLRHAYDRVAVDEHALAPRVWVGPAKGWAEVASREIAAP